MSTLQPRDKHEVQLMDVSHSAHSEINIISQDLSLCFDGAPSRAICLPILVRATQLGALGITLSLQMHHFVLVPVGSPIWISPRAVQPRMAIPQHRHRFRSRIWAGPCTAMSRRHAPTKSLVLSRHTTLQTRLNHPTPVSGCVAPAVHRA